MRTLTAEAAYGMSGQFIARITGRDKKYTFNREFIGRKGGKRNESTSADVDEPGLYECCNVGKRGKDSDFYLIVEWPATADDPIRKLSADKEDAMKIAKAMDEGRPFQEIVGVFLAEPDANGKRFVAYELLSAKAAEKKQSGQTLG